MQMSVGQHETRRVVDFHQVEVVGRDEDGGAERLQFHDLPEIVDFYRMSGEIDYLLKAYVADIAAYDALYKKLISRIDLSDVTSMFAMEELKSTSAIPLGFAER